jgi:hypothetical protein
LARLGETERDVCLFGVLFVALLCTGESAQLFFLNHTVRTIIREPFALTVLLYITLLSSVPGK